MKPRIKIVFIGDSLTAGTGMYDYAEHLTDNLPKIFKRFARFEFINNAAGGSTTDYMVTNMVGHIINNHPDIVAIMYGANDQFGSPNPAVSLTQFRTNWETVIDAVNLTTNSNGGNNGKPVILLMSHCITIAQGMTVLTRSFDYAEVTRDVASEKGTEFVDCFNIWWGYSPDGQKYNINTRDSDGIHPNDLSWRAVIPHIENKFRQIIWEKYLKPEQTLYTDSKHWNSRIFI